MSVLGSFGVQDEGPLKLYKAGLGANTRYCYGLVEAGSGKLRGWRLA